MQHSWVKCEAGKKVAKSSFSQYLCNHIMWCCSLRCDIVFYDHILWPSRPFSVKVSGGIWAAIRTSLSATSVTSWYWLLISRQCSFIPWKSLEAGKQITLADGGRLLVDGGRKRWTGCSLVQSHVYEQPIDQGWPCEPAREHNSSGQHPPFCPTPTRNFLLRSIRLAPIFFLAIDTAAL